MILSRFSKNKQSAFTKARGEPIYTCGIEHGFVWKKHVDCSNREAPILNVEKALYDGLEAELKIQRENVASWTVSTLAIQHSHLNAALLGVVKLKLTREELQQRINFPTRYFDSVDFLSRQQAIATIRTDKGTRKWHQTGLMRLSLLEQEP